MVECSHCGICGIHIYLCSCHENPELSIEKCYSCNRQILEQDIYRCKVCHALICHLCHNDHYHGCELTFCHECYDFLEDCICEI